MPIFPRIGIKRLSELEIDADKDWNTRNIDNPGNVDGIDISAHAANPSAHHIKTSDANEITSGRFGMARMPDGTSGKVLTAQGAGVDPAYADAPGIPSGVIAMWHGLIANIPSGWVICDGNNSTPNLLDRFVQSVPTAGTNPGGTGGATSKTTSGHTHSVTLPGNKANLSSGPYIPAAQTLTSGSKTDSISDIRPKYYQVAFIMKT